MKKDLGETIVAIATPQGVGAIGVIRVSGPNAISLTDKYFFGKNLNEVDGHTVHYGKIRNEEGAILDECLATVFKSPRSYTKENIVELSCHGSIYILNEIVRLFVRNGARLAEPGEFTLRAFLNGQFDLSQAEAIGDLIASASKGSHDLAIKQMRGGFSKEISVLRQELIDFAALIELELDFSEEDVEFADRSKLVGLIDKIQKVVRRLIQSFHLGNVIKHGVTTVIAGRPNAGKSTLLNALLNDERAIVSEIAGTTRDTIEETLNINGVLFRLIDTAGIRNTQDIIEKKGVERTIEKISKSTVVIYLFDIIESTAEELWQDVEHFLEGESNSDAKYIFVANKMDLNPYTKAESYYKENLIDKSNLLPLSAKKQYECRSTEDYALRKCHSKSRTVGPNRYQ